MSIKVLLVGWDGASFDTLNKYLAEGMLPNIQQLIKRGILSSLRSVTPSMTPSAWPSVLTGVTPEQHGIFGWDKVSFSDYELRPSNRKHIRFPMLWSYLNMMGKKVGIVNVPLTSPPPRVQGFFISGFDNPFESNDQSSKICYPSDILDNYTESTNSYEILPDVDSHKLSDNELVVRWNHTEEVRIDIARKLFHDYDPEFAMIVFHVTDYFSHKYTPSERPLQFAYERADKSLGKLLEECDEQTTIIVMSDHGNTELHKFVYIQNWLNQNGLLRFKETISDSNVSHIYKEITDYHSVFINPPEQSRLVEMLGKEWLVASYMRKCEITTEIRKVYPGCCITYDNIDWENTKAYSPLEYAQIYLNVLGRQPKGIVHPKREYADVAKFIVEGLKKLVDPDTGEHIMGMVRAKGLQEALNIFNESPDIVCSPKDPSYLLMKSFSLHLFSNRIIGPVFPERARVGDHTPYGILAMAGPLIKPGALLDNPSILDIAPTILHLLGFSIPSYMEGKAWTEAFLSDAIPQYIDIDFLGRSYNSTDEEYQRKEIDQIREKLRILGYRI